MGLETGTYISDLVITNPTAADPKSQGDDHLRLLKSTLKTTFPNITNIVTSSHAELNYVTGVTSGIQAQFATKGAIAAQTWGAGLHDFSLGTLRSASPVNIWDVVNKSYADALSFNAALPSQTGNSGKFVTTNGTTASWAEQTFISTTTVVKDSVDATKELGITVSGITTGTKRTWTSQDRNGTVAYLDDTALVLLAVMTPTAAANIDFLNVFTAAYDDYVILIDGIAKSTASLGAIQVRLATGGAVDSGATNYAFSNSKTAGVGAATSTFTVTGNITNPEISGKIEIFNANGAGSKTLVSDLFLSTGAVPYIGHGIYTPANVISGFRIYISIGENFAAKGRVRVYGYKPTT